MRICHIIESAAGGSAAIMASLARHSVRRGHQVHILYSPDRADPHLINALTEGGCTSVSPTPMRRQVTPSDAADGLALRRALTALGPLDVIHSHSSKAGALARFFGRFRRTAQVYSPHGFYTMTGEAPGYVGLVERLLSRITDRIIAVSDHEKRHAIEIGIAPQKVTVIPNGIAPYRPMSRTAARKQLGLFADVFAVGFVGRLSKQKDPFAALDVIARLSASADVMLVMIGDGELRAELERKAAEHRIPVSFHGPLDAKKLFSAFDCLLCTSKYEGMPVTFLESVNCGVPIVSFPVGGTDELVRPDETGFITAPTASGAAGALKRLADMPGERRKAMSKACRALAASHTDVIMGDDTLALYEQLVRHR